MPVESRVMMDEKETLLDVCLETHMAYTGSSDPLTNERLSRNIKILATAIDCWREDNTKWKPFDDAVLALCTATLNEQIKNEPKPTIHDLRNDARLVIEAYRKGELTDHLIERLEGTANFFPYYKLLGSENEPRKPYIESVKSWRRALDSCKTTTNPSTENEPCPNCMYDAQDVWLCDNCKKKPSVYQSEGQTIFDSVVEFNGTFTTVKTGWLKTVFAGDCRAAGKQIAILHTIIIEQTTTPADEKPAEQTEGQECSVNSFMSRICEHGTSGCTVKHTTPADEDKPGRILMPRELTAENGAKAHLIGEFEERVVNPIYCSCCSENCELCEITEDNDIDPYMGVGVSWTTIKKIYSAAVRYFENKE